MCNKPEMAIVVVWFWGLFGGGVVGAGDGKMDWTLLGWLESEMRLKIFYI